MLSVTETEATNRHPGRGDAQNTVATPVKMAEYI